MTRRVVPADTTAADKAQVRVRKRVRRWSATFFPVRFLDADEPPDPIEFAGFSAASDEAVSRPTKCLGYACPSRSDSCSDCELSEVSADEEHLDVLYEELAEVVRENQRFVAMLMQLPRYPVLHSRNDGRQYLHLAAPTFRGLDRMAIELQLSRQVSF